MSRALKIAIPLIILFALYSVLGLWILPAWIEQQVDKATDRDAVEQAGIDRIDFNPYTLRLELSGISVHGIGKQWSFQSDAAAIDLSVRTLFAWRPILDAVEFDAPELTLRRGEDFKDLEADVLLADGMARDGQKEETIVPRIEIDRFAVTNGSLHYTDDTLKNTYEEKLHPIQFVLKDFSAEGESPASIRFTANTESDARLVGESALSSAPIEVDGKFQLSELKVEQLSPYYADYLGFRVENARLDFESKYTLSLSDAANWLRIREGVVQLRDIRLDQRVGNDRRRLFDLDQIKAAGLAYTLPENKLTIDTVQASGGQTAFWREPEGQLNWSRAVQFNRKPDDATGGMSEAAEATDGFMQSQPFSYEIQTISISGHRVLWFGDASDPSGSSKELELSLQSLEAKTLTDDLSAPVELRANLKIGDEGSAEMDGSLIPKNFTPNISIKLEGVPIQTAVPFFAPNYPLKKATGSLDFKGRLGVATTERLLLTGDGSVQALDVIYQIPPRLHLEGTRLKISGLKLRFHPFLIELDEADAEKLNARMPAETEPKRSANKDAPVWFRFATASATDLAYDASENDLRIETLGLTEGTATAWQVNSTEKIRVVPSFVPPPLLDQLSGTENEQVEPGGTPFTFSIAHFDASDGAIDWIRHPEAVPIMNVEIPQLSAQKLSSDKSERFSLSGEARFPEGGSLSLQGDLQLEKPDFSWSLQVEQLPLDFLSDLFAEWEDFEITSGHFNFDGQLESGSSAEHRSSGQGSVESLAARFTGYPQVDAKWDSFDFSGLDLVGRPLAVNLQSAELSRPEFVIKWTEQSAANEKGKADKSDWSGLTIGSAQVRDGRLTLVDTGVSPKVNIPFEDLSLTLEDFHLDGSSPATVQLDATVPQGSILVDGELHPLRFRKATSLDVEIDALNLPQVSPYAAKGIGRSIDRGTADIESKWFVDDGSVDASNNVLIDQLNLGAPTDGSATSKVPIRLVAQMLKSPEGRIEFQLPVSGDIGNPNIRFAGIIREALTRQLTDIATSPFRRLSSLVGAIRFIPGTGQVPDTMDQRLNVLADALNKDPGLQLEIIPQITPQDVQSIEDKRIFAETVNTVVPDLTEPASERQLAEERVEAIKVYLIDEKGIEAARLSVSAFEEVEETPGIRFELE